MTEVLAAPAIRSHIRDAVSNALAVLNETSNEAQRSGDDATGRCVVCTLPLGQCGHTQEWLLARTDRVLYALDEAEEEIRDALSVVDDVRALTVTGMQQQGPEFTPVDFRWKSCEVVLSDRIGGTYVDLSSPGRRAAHTAVACGVYIVVFGGVELVKGRKQVSSKLHVFNTQTYTWHLPAVSGEKPTARHGHAAVALNDDEMLMFGGRGQSGMFMNDTWIFSMRDATWTRIEDSATTGASYNFPAPRYRAATTRLADKVYLSGGTDGDTVFDDFYAFSLAARRWQRHVTVGDVPLGRFGHQLVAVRHELYLLGGSTVVPSSENWAVLDVLDLAAHVQHAQQLLHSYVDEREHIEFMSRLVELKATDSDNIRAMCETASSATWNIVDHAARVSEAEAHFVRTISNARVAGLPQTSNRAPPKHGSVSMDVYKMNPATLVWTRLRKTRGPAPSARRDFMALPFPNMILVACGCSPVSEYRVLEEDGVTVFKLDLSELMWSVVEVGGTSTAMQPLLDAARADVRRARSRVQAARAQGFVVGAPSGVTRDVLLAEAVEKVCSWRVAVLEQEASRFRSAPDARAGLCFARVGARAFCQGGWGADETALSNEFFVLDMEHEQAKQERLQSEFHARLEKERAGAEAAARTSAALTAFELREQWQAEREREAQETVLMQKEDALSRLPPLSQAPAPMLRLALHNGMIIHWRPVLQNVNRKRLQPGVVTYALQMQGGFFLLRKGEEIEVHYVLQPGIDSRGVWYPATVQAANHDGTFDIRTHDGRIERQVDAKRIRPALKARQQWSTLYVGKGASPKSNPSSVPVLACSRFACAVARADTEYAITGLVPDRVLQHNPLATVNVTLRLQMLGADEPEGTWSIPSPAATFSTQPSLIVPSEHEYASTFAQSSAASEVSFSVLTATETTAANSVKTANTSRARKRLLKAVAAGQQTQICTHGEETTATGCGDAYM